MIKLKKTYENPLKDTLWSDFKQIEDWAKARGFKVLSKKRGKLTIKAKDDDDQNMILEYTNGK